MSVAEGTTAEKRTGAIVRFEIAKKITIDPHQPDTGQKKEEKTQRLKRQPKEVAGENAVGIIEKYHKFQETEDRDEPIHESVQVLRIEDGLDLPRPGEVVIDKGLEHSEKRTEEEVPARKPINAWIEQEEGESYENEQEEDEA